MKTLKQVKVGEDCRVVKLHGEGAVKRRIVDMGITRGTDIHVVRVAPLGDPVEVTVRGYAASGTATVMIRNSCASEGVGDGRNGFCIEENAAAMAAKLEELCRAPEVMQVAVAASSRRLIQSAMADE